MSQKLALVQTGQGETLALFVHLLVLRRRSRAVFCDMDSGFSFWDERNFNLSSEKSSHEITSIF